MVINKKLVISAILSLAVIFAAVPATSAMAAVGDTGFSHQLSVKVVKSNGTYKTVNKENNMMKKGASVMGVPYVSGGSTPAGFDCSGYVAWLMHQENIGLVRSTAASYYKAGYNVGSISKAHKGDIVLYSYGGGICHCGIYYGNAKVIQATCSTGIDVRAYDGIGQSVAGVIRTYTPAGALKIVQTNSGEAVKGVKYEISGNGYDNVKTTNASGEIGVALKTGKYTITAVDDSEKGASSVSKTVNIRYGKTKTVSFSGAVSGQTDDGTVTDVTGDEN